MISFEYVNLTYVSDPCDTHKSAIENYSLKDIIIIGKTNRGNLQVRPINNIIYSMLKKVF